ncbi:MAG: Crp/Fnr family transcriptional regulator [Gammaproteobacteria bacterium]
MKANAAIAAWQGHHKCENCAIRDGALFARLIEEDFQRIHLPIEELAFRRGEVIFHAASAVEHVFTIRSGLVKLVQISANGNQRIVRLLRRGDLLGMERLSGAETEYDAIALNDVEVCKIPLAVVQALQAESPRLYEQLMQQWHRALSEAGKWLAELSTGPARCRVTRLLLLLDEYKEGERFFLPTREEMGAILGITTESTSKVTAEFKRAGWLELHGASEAGIDRETLSGIEC